MLKQLTFSIRCVAYLSTLLPMSLRGPFTDQFVVAPVDRTYFRTTDGTLYCNISIEVRIDGALDMQYQVPHDLLLPCVFETDCRRICQPIRK
jgi:hypothetical protein